MVGSSEGQSKVEGGRGVAVVARSRGRQLVEWKDQKIVVPCQNNHGFPFLLFFGSICLLAVGPGASPPQEDSQELQ